MFCKYCGHPAEGNRCPRCGKEIILTAHSTELEALMAKKAARESAGPVRAEETAYAQGFDAGYRKGLSEACEKSTAAAPAPRPFPLRAAAVLCAVLLLVSSAVSGILFRNAGFRSGMARGKEEGIRTADESLEKKYQEGYSRGRSDAEEALEKKYSEGYQQGKADALEQAEQEKLQEPQAGPSSGSTVSEEDILFSRTKNGGMKSLRVKAVQEMLYELNMYQPGTARDTAADGDYGPMTEDAVSRFQKANGLPETGAMDRTTFDTLLEAYFQDSGMEAENVKDPADTVPPPEKNPDDTENPASPPEDHPQAAAPDKPAVHRFADFQLPV